MAAPVRRALRRAGSKAGDYLETKGLWNDPGSGRFIRKGRSTEKARVIQALTTAGISVRDAARAHDDGVRARVVDNLMRKGRIQSGDVVRVRYRNDTHGRVRVETPSGKGRWYDVQWDRFEPVGDTGASAPTLDDLFAPERRVDVLKWLKDLMVQTGSGDTFAAAVTTVIPGLDPLFDDDRDPRAPLVAELLAQARLAYQFDSPHVGPTIADARGDTWHERLADQVRRSLSRDFAWATPQEMSTFDLQGHVDRTRRDSPLMNEMEDLFGWPTVSGSTGMAPTIGGFNSYNRATGPLPESTIIVINLDTTWAPSSSPTFGPPEGLQKVVDQSISGALRHEYGHYLDSVYRHSAAFAVGTMDSKRGVRVNLINAFQRRPTFAVKVSPYAATAPDELIAELWAAISHPGYASWKLTLTDPDEIARWDLAESYFNPAGVPWYEGNPSITTTPTGAAP